ncbi:MAG: hypothetical protein ACREIA_18020 [Opitutaceae bacterium]
MLPEFTLDVVGKSEANDISHAVRNPKVVSGAADDNGLIVEIAQNHDPAPEGVEALGHGEAQQRARQNLV